MDIIENMTEQVLDTCEYIKTTTGCSSCPALRDCIHIDFRKITTEELEIIAKKLGLLDSDRALKEGK